MTIKRSFRITTICVLSLIGLSASCTTHRTGGRDFNTNVISNIIIGKTTKNEVSSYLGQPFQTRGEIDGSEAWYYGHVKRKKTFIPSPSSRVDLNREERTEKSVKVIFGKNGVVKECIYGTYSNVGTPFQSETAISTGRGNTTKTRCQDVR